MRTDPVAVYVAEVEATLEDAAGRPLRSGCDAIGFDDRTSNVAIVYDLPGRALIAASPALTEAITPVVERLAAAAPGAVGQAELLGALGSVGGSEIDRGRNLVLRTPSHVSRGDLEVRWLDPSSADIALVESLAAACDPDDVEAVEIDLEVPDPRICLLLDADGAPVAYASGRPFWASPSCDDVGVLVHPECRGDGLGAAVVATYVGRFAADRPQLYRHDMSNVGSAGVARRVGFEHVHDVVAVSFDGA